ncbi:RagB/SusD family nutrient uptake outer membrane protein [Dyadobacter aurulentus]|uniref:RagB/SusD family nutrient uptake outer membrane protein n=1 Tax=Dyadobacter sp. UC 10 TaxID=2605428 RepID=UPI0011F15FD9|nr:RagB/SusD family nutrient uptake outer membrane protein [Dyadobacter sp. UC 10]KAA0988851.1 RagB/SusD family nutrient uptake outer membrane protein [Dyadobacter sp. UC 10]
MKLFKKHIFYILAALSAISCSESELDQYPETRLSEGNFYTTEAQIVQAVNDVYRQLNRSYAASGLVDLYGELYSDNTYIEFSGGSTTFEDDIKAFRIQPNNGPIQTAWNNSYNSVYICNNAISQLEKTTVQFGNPALKDRLKAEATFIRSLIFFNMVRVWGDIPMPLKVVSADESYTYLREKKETIYQQIIADLKASKAALPEKYAGADVGRITKYAATAILAKVYLTIGDKTNAAKELKEIIDSHVYSLDANQDGKVNSADYAFNFAPGTKNSKESILELQFLAGQNAVNSNYQQTYTPYHWAFHLPGSSETFRGSGLNSPTPDLTNEFEAADTVRRNVSVYPGYVNLETGAFVKYPFTQKYYDPNWRYPGQNVELVRYADVLLSYSEATGDASYLNQVRERVGLPGYGKTGYPDKYSTLALAIEHERRTELCFEFHRFFDLVRTGRAVEVLKSKGFNITESKLLFPIPQSAIDVNPGLTQNSY